MRFLFLLAVLIATPYAHAADNCQSFPDHLKECVPFSCVRSFAGLAGSDVSITIEGKNKDGKCVHLHRFSHGAYMECATSNGADIDLFIKSFSQTGKELQLSKEEAERLVELVKADCTSGVDGT